MKYILTDHETHVSGSRICPTGYFHCSNARCINEHKRCDHVNDCGDQSDEHGCGCREDEFECRTNHTCILALYRCDHDKDCPDASDEMGCNNTDCTYFSEDGESTVTLIKCNHTNACILPSWRCDGHDDCWDNSDEQGCPTSKSQVRCCSRFIP